VRLLGSYSGEGRLAGTRSGARALLLGAQEVPSILREDGGRNRWREMAMTDVASFDAPEPWTPPSWEQIVEEHSPRVYRLAYRLTGNQHDAEDLTQETFVRVFRSLSNYQPGTFEGWLHRITTNLFLDQVRRKARIRFEALADDGGAQLVSPVEIGRAHV